MPEVQLKGKNSRSSYRTYKRVVVKQSGFVLCMKEGEPTMHYPISEIAKIRGEVQYE